jgi:hypothetical protein
MVTEICGQMPSDPIANSIRQSRVS